MVDKHDLLLGISEEILQGKQKDQSGTYIFISFDLVNSTAFKMKYPDWPLIFDDFYTTCEDDLFKRVPHARLWKRIGDEVLFFSTILAANELPEVIESVFATTEFCINRVNENTKELDRLLSVKATIWAAYVRDRAFSDTAFPVNSVAQNQAPPYARKDGTTEPVVASEECKKNYLIRPKTIHDNEVDFLGPDIDIGFRISKFALQGKLVVDAKLALLASKQEPACGRPAVGRFMRVVSYETLKGVWDSRKYPIVWYHNKWDTPDDMFFYDERFQSEIVQELIRTDMKSAQKITLLSKVFWDLNKLKEIDELEKGISIYTANNPKGLARRDIPRDRLCEVHLVCVCVNEKNEVMIARRPADKRRFPNLWEFGCNQLHLNEKIEDSLISLYKTEFGIEISFPTAVAVPIGTYCFRDDAEERLIPGIIFVAEVKRKNSCKFSYSQDKHTEVRWASLADVKKIPAKECVEGFHDRTKMALEQIKKIRGKAK